MKKKRSKPKIILACVVWIVIGIFIFITSSATASATSVSIGSVDITLGESVTLPIMIGNAEEEISCATILLTYDNSIAKVGSVEKGDFDSLVFNVDNANGKTRIVVYQTGESGLTGDIKIADVTIEAVGIGSASLNLKIETLKNNIGDKVTADVISGSFTVRSPGDGGGSGVSGPTLSPSPSPSTTPPAPPENEKTISPTPPIAEEPKTITVHVQIQVENVTAEKGKIANISIKIKGVEGKGLSYANVTLNYNPSVVDIEDAGESDFDSFIYNVPSKGCLRMVAYQTGAEGLKGDVKFAEIQVKAVGKANESSELKLEVKELKDNEGFPVHFEVEDGCFSIKSKEGAGHEPSKPIIPTVGVVETIAVIVGSYLVIRLRRRQ